MTNDTSTVSVNFRKYPEAYDWSAMKIFSEGRVEMLEFCLQEDPSIVSYRHIMAYALQNANFVVVNGLLQSGATLRSTDIDAAKALHIAIRRRNKALVNILLRLGADANSRLPTSKPSQDALGRTPLYEALLNAASNNHDHDGPCVDSTCSFSASDTIRLLLKYSADPNAKQIGDETALHKAVAVDIDKTYVQSLLVMGADVEARNDRQDSVLDLAVDASLRTIETLCEYGVNLDAKNFDGRTSLLRALEIYPDDAVRVKKLIECGADVHAKTFVGKTVLHVARSSSEGILQQFLDLGVELDARDHGGRTALWYAVCQGDIAKLVLLLGSGAVFGAENWPPLVKAATRGNKEMVDILLSMDHDPRNSRYMKGRALFCAVKVAANDVVTGLLEAGADPNFVDVSRMTPLTQAMMNKDKKIRRLLIQASADIQLPLDAVPVRTVQVTIASGEVDLVEFLIQQGLDVSKIRSSDASVRPHHSQMRSFLAKIGVPFTVDNESDNDEHRHIHPPQAPEEFWDVRTHITAG